METQHSVGSVEQAEQANPQDERGSRKRIITMLAVLAVGVIAFAVVPTVLMYTIPHPHGTLYDEPQPVDFELPNVDGGTFRLSDYQGKVVVVYFGYTSCPDVCPTTLLDLSKTMDELGEDADEVEVVFVTIDPEVDTPDRIESYLGYFDESFIGTYGTEEQLQDVRDIFDVTVLRSDEGEAIPGYGITHTTSMFVVDREGLLKMRMHHATDVDLLVQDLEYFIKGRL